MTLSHRWGRWSCTILKSDTEQQLQTAIDINNLPQTFQDAITVALHLGIYYIWIDALCIKQDKDDRSDWENESLNMDKIYSCAFLNVSATMSIDGSESLLRDQPENPYYPSEIELEANRTLQKFFVVDGATWFDDIDDGPLNKRGWVFQERFMARRILHFGQHQLGWECRELAALEIFPNGLPRASAMSLIAKPKLEARLDMLTRNPEEADGIEFTELWQLLVQQYSRCVLTEPEDKLIAFSGIAKRLMRIRDDVYTFGMWKKNMVYDLGWWRPTEVREAFPIDKTSLRAPSWSWASVDGETIFPSTYGGLRDRFIEIEEILEPVKNEKNDSTTGTAIRVRVCCLPLSVEWSNESICSFKVAGVRFRVGDSAKGSLISLETHKEAVRNHLRGGRLLFLPLFATSYFLHGLVVTKIRGVCAHRRLGAVEIPVMTDSVSPTFQVPSGEIDQHEQWHRFQPDVLEGMMPQEVNQSIPVDRFRSVAADKIICYLLGSRGPYRLINIY